MSCRTIVILSCCLDNQRDTFFSAVKLNLSSMHVNTLAFPKQKYSYSKVSWLWNWIFLSLDHSPLHFLFLLACAYRNAQPKPLYFSHNAVGIILFSGIKCHHWWSEPKIINHLYLRSKSIQNEHAINVTVMWQGKSASKTGAKMKY